MREPCFMSEMLTKCQEGKWLCGYNCGPQPSGWAAASPNVPPVPSRLCFHFLSLGPYLHQPFLKSCLLSSSFPCLPCLWPCLVCQVSRVVSFKICIEMVWLLFDTFTIIFPCRTVCTLQIRMSPEVALHRISPALSPFVSNVVRNGKVGLDATNCLRITDLKSG